MNLMNRPNRNRTAWKDRQIASDAVIQWRRVAWFLIFSNGAHVQIFWSAVNKSSARDSARTIRAQKGATWEEPITPDTQLDIHPRKISSKLEG